MKSSLVRGFHGSVVVILLLTALAKLWSAFGKAPVLYLPDPLLGFTNRQMLLMMAALEFVIGGCLVARLQPQIKHLLIAWLGSNFLLYRLFLAILKPGTYCKCLGTLTYTLHLSDQTANYILTLMALYLVVGGLSLYCQHRIVVASSYTDEI